ncbi:MAG: gluconate 2-dehydrogenase subunit 3 family protein [Acidobacteriota bacterium]
MNRRELIALAGLLGAGKLAPEPLLAWAGAQRATAETELRAFDEGQYRVFDALSELILPATDTPGARAAGVASFADRFLAEWFPAKARDSFLAGLDGFEAHCVETQSAGFADCDVASQTAVAEWSQEQAIAQRKGFSSNPRRIGDAEFFDVAKWLTLFGYYTSEVGMREELSWRAVPGRWDGCRDV